ncbi:MAG: hypothetical protein P8173_17295 [Gammaproteobacteria bacterium]
MRRSRQWIAGLASIALIALPASLAWGQQSGQTTPSASMEARAQQTINTFKRKAPALVSFFTNSAGYAVFPSIAEGAFIIGGAHGKGLVYVHGQPVGKTSVSQASIGAQIGGQTFSELIFFKTPQVLSQFKEGNYAMSAGVSAVAAASGVAQAANYTHGVAVFITSSSGLMAQAAVGGQKFSYQPFAMGGDPLPAQSETGSSADGGQTRK